MKKTQGAVLCLLAILVVLSVVISAFQIQKNNAIRQQMKNMEKEIAALKKEAEEKEKENQKLAEEKEEMEAKAEELQAKQQEEEEQAVPEEEETEENGEEETVVSEVSGNGRKVAIDPGHQGYHVDMSELEPLGPGSQEMKAKATTGTEGKFTGVPEYELNLTISKQLKEELEARGYEVMLTRQDNDTAISNRERAILASDFGADIYVRIHANGSDDSSVDGALTMVPSANNPYVSYLHDKSYALGEAILNAYCQACGMRNRGVQYYDNMTGINWSTVPVTILEMGFMSNESDDRNMQDGEFQVKMVQGIANGIDQYFEAGN